MSTPIRPELFTSEMLAILEETFTKTHGIYLDGGTSLSETMDRLTAAQASAAPAAGVYPVCAHVIHALFYLRLLERILRGEDVETVEWEMTWRTLSVTPDEWSALQTGLLETYGRLVTLFTDIEDWNAEDRLGNALAILAHTAYHIGAVRQIAQIASQAPRPPILGEVEG